MRGVYYSVSARESGDADGAVAQLVAHHTGSVGVRGSSPLGSTGFDLWIVSRGDDLLITPLLTEINVSDLPGSVA
jgi:hypothetical protein